MNVMLHLLEIAGLVILFLLVIAIPAAFIALGLLDRRDRKREEAEDAKARSVLPSQSRRYMPTDDDLSDIPPE